MVNRSLNRIHGVSPQLEWIGNIVYRLLHCILHCDVNLYNGLFDVNLLLKVVDLGLAKMSDRKDKEH